MEVTYNMATRRKYPVRLPKGECILNAVALAVLAFAYLSNAEIFRENYRKIIGLLLENIWSPQFYGTLTKRLSNDFESELRNFRSVVGDSEFSEVKNRFLPILYEKVELSSLRLLNFYL